MIPYGRQFESRLLHFQPNSLLKCLGREWKMYPCWKLLGYVDPEPTIGSFTMVLKISHHQQEASGLGRGLRLQEVRDEAHLDWRSSSSSGLPGLLAQVLTTV